MPAAKRRKRRLRIQYNERPQDYEHRVEVAIEALFHASVGIQMLVRFLQQQQTPDWKSMRLIDVATEDFGKAIGWLENRDAKRAVVRRRRR